MVTRPEKYRHARQRGVIIAELMVAVSLLLLAVLPLSVAFFREQASVRALYHRAVAMEIVDGEMEALLAGAWRAQPAGTRTYPVHAEAAEGLPRGKFLLTVSTNQLRLEWRPDTRGAGGPVVREVALPPSPPQGETSTHLAP